MTTHTDDHPYRLFGDPSHLDESRIQQDERVRLLQAMEREQQDQDADRMAGLRLAAFLVGAALIGLCGLVVAVVLKS